MSYMSKVELGQWYRDPNSFSMAAESPCNSGIVFFSGRLSLKFGQGPRSGDAFRSVVKRDSEEVVTNTL